MALDNLISVEFTQSQLSDVNAALDIIESVIKGKVVNLSPEERQQYGRINNNTENWIEKVKAYMEQKPNLVPFYIDKAEFDKDHEARKNMLSVLNRIASINESIDDTTKLLSTDIYNAAIAYYRNIKLISQQNVPGTTNIYQDLADQFPGRSSAVAEEAPMPDTGAETPENTPTEE